MKNRKKNAPVTYEGAKKSNAELRRQKMPSAKPENKTFEISWGNVQSAIEQFLRATGKIPRDKELLSLTFEDFNASHFGIDKVVKGQLIMKEEEVRLIKG